MIFLEFDDENEFLEKIKQNQIECLIDNNPNNTRFFLKHIHPPLDIIYLKNAYINKKFDFEDIIVKYWNMKELCENCLNATILNDYHKVDPFNDFSS